MPRQTSGRCFSIDSYGRNLAVRLALLLALAVPAAGQRAIASGTSNDYLQNDAELADIFFLDQKLGWAVGDRGVIWHTRDGGSDWQPQVSHVHCRLSSVFFLDALHGWAAGGWTQPFTHVPQGVVLKTSDGGKHWTPVRRLLVPTLQRIKFFNMKEGVAIGRSSAMFPSGVFVTEDGGQSWTPLPARKASHFTAGDFIDLDTGALAGSGGALATVRRRAIDAVPGDTGQLAVPRRMLLAPPISGWLVGDGGLILKTADLGRSWQTAADHLPEGSQRYFDFQAVAQQKDRLWVAGSPGSRVFHSTDGGESWHGQPTGSTVPLCDLHFIDQKHGWAAGALGTILATRDGGRTWRLQRSGGRRAALLGIFSEPRRTPLELLAKLCGGDGYLGMCEYLVRRDLDLQSAVSPDWREQAHEALVQLGGCGAENAWRFPLRQQGLDFSAEQILAILDNANDGAALDHLEAHLVRQIRLWRPEVIFTHHVSTDGNDPLGHLINQLVLRSVERAADSTRYVELAAATDLEAWQVKKVYGVLPPGESGTVSINSSRLEPRLGRSLADLSSEAHGLLSRTYKAPPVEMGFRLLYDHLPQQEGRRDFFAGIALSPGGDARRMLGEANADTLTRLRKMAQQRRNMQQLIHRSTAPGALSGAWSGQIADLTRGLDAPAACQLLYQLALSYRESGHWDLAASTLQALVDRHPQHPLADSAQVWLLRYYASGEAAWRARRRSGRGVQLTGAITAAGAQGQQAGAQPAGTADVRGTGGGVGKAVEQAQERLQQALDIGRQIETRRPMLFAEPELRFALAAAQRRVGLGGEAGKFYMLTERTRAHDSWWECAQAEEWLRARSEQLPPKAYSLCKSAGEKPHLDGKLHEPFWQAAQAMPLRSVVDDDGAWPATAKLAFDEEFLYLALHCRKAGAVEYSGTDQLRSRDADLEHRDRVRVLIDVDRDYATYYDLTIDHRGWTRDACWGDPSWNPTWYVAQASDENAWTSEIAIPLRELTGERPQSGQVWAVGIQRIVPTAGFQSWSQPAGAEIQPSGFGLVEFR